jgi:hypothetical protein
MSSILPKSLCLTQMSRRINLSLASLSACNDLNTFLKSAVSDEQEFFPLNIEMRVTLPLTTGLRGRAFKGDSAHDRTPDDYVRFLLITFIGEGVKVGSLAFREIASLLTPARLKSIRVLNLARLRSA